MQDIMHVLEEIDEFDWAMRRPSTNGRGVDLMYPPIISWRYKQPTVEKENLLKHLIESFRGAIAWELSSEHRNWVLRPARVKEYAEAHGLLGELEAAQQLMTSDPEFGKQANRELFVLAEHIHGHLNKHP